MTIRYVAAGVVLLLGGWLQAEEFVSSRANNGNLIMQDVPPIPEIVVSDLNQFQNVRSARMLDWTEDGRSLYVDTRFADVYQIHRIDMPLGARRQLTFFKEPVGEVLRRPGHSELVFSRDAGGSEFAQLFVLDPDNGSTSLLTDGQSRNGAAVWDRSGRNLAYQSTHRNGASNDVWLMNPDDPASDRLILESPDGTWWGPQEFSASGSEVLILNYVSIADSRVHLLNLDSGTHELLAGGGDTTSANFPIGFDQNDDGYWLITDQGGEFGQLAWQGLTPGTTPQYVTGGIPWDIDSAAISNDRRRMAFIANENGLSRLYLMDADARKYRAVDGIPAGLAYGLKFSPDDSRLAMTLNTARTPSDTFVLELGDGPLDYGGLKRWSESEVGGLKTSAFIAPELVQFPTFDEVAGKTRQIPAWLYKPPGAGPYPVVVSIHGGPEGQARPYFSSTYQMWLAKLGVAIVVPNVRGSAGYGKSYLALDNGFKREDSVKDIGALLDWINTNPDLDASRVAVFGGSYGGYMVLASAVHFSDKLKAAVDIVGISSFVTFLENTQDYRRDLRRAEYGDEREPEMRKHLQRISPVNNVTKINVPMFIVQGQNDPRVPVTESEQMVEALRKQGLPVWYMNALNEGHGYQKKENRDVYQQATLLFLRQHLLNERPE
jgi:dipeptidyl aminopeptidase/acylaminoacyl peptidase